MQQPASLILCSLTIPYILLAAIACSTSSVNKVSRGQGVGSLIFFVLMAKYSVEVHFAFLEGGEELEWLDGIGDINVSSSTDDTIALYSESSQSPGSEYSGQP